MALKFPAIQSIHPHQYAYIGKEPCRNFETCQKKPLPPILCPCIQPGRYPHYGKEPNSNKLRMAYEEKFQKNNEANLPRPTPIDLEKETLVEIRMENRVQNLRLQRDIKKKVQEKIDAYEAAIDKRRQKLKDLYYIEEQCYIRETVDQAIKGEHEKLEDMRKAAEKVRAKRAEERQQLVHQKKIQQYINLCDELRPEVIKKHLYESKNTNLQQMRENEAKREIEKELDKMWFELNERENQIRIEREAREAAARKALDLSLHETWFKQKRGKELLKAEEKKMILEDKLEFERLNELRKQEELEKLKQKRKDQESLLADLKKQIEIHQEYQRKKEEEENKLDNTYLSYSLQGLGKERADRLAKKERTKREEDLYRYHLKQMEIERKIEEEKLNEIMELYKNEIQKKQDEAQCKVIAAREELKRSCLLGLAQQVALKQQEAENQLKAKQAENELLEIYYQANTRLQYESDLLGMVAAKQYKEDLKQQIEYRDMMRKRERDELERQYKKGKEEEERYQKLVAEIIKTDTENPAHKHPFRKVLEQTACDCDELQNKKTSI